jgi:hypothetical protein
MDKQDNFLIDSARLKNGATTISIMTLSITTFSIMTLSIAINEM